MGYAGFMGYFNSYSSRYGGGGAVGDPRTNSHTDHELMIQFL